ncbi:hypothetical protein C3737_10970 [Aeromonas jandaei]|nr:hypothetical protein C3737_10970 [Aeromonas jandaei]
MIHSQQMETMLDESDAGPGLTERNEALSRKGDREEENRSSNISVSQSGQAILLTSEGHPCGHSGLSRKRVTLSKTRAGSHFFCRQITDELIQQGDFGKKRAD